MRTRGKRIFCHGHLWLTAGVSFMMCLPAFPAESAENYGSFPFLPQVSLWGYTGAGTSGFADVLTPVWGNDNTIFYLDPQGKLDDDQNWLASVGLGYRHTVSDNNLWGAYFFMDANAISDSPVFWFANPGAEWMNTLWGSRLNLYLPIGSQTRTTGTVFSDEIGRNDEVSFQDHQQFAFLYDQVEQVGPGLDLQVSRIFPKAHNLKVSVGGYHFDFKDNPNMTGAEIRAELPLNARFSLSLADSYDNYRHNTALLGVSLHLGRSYPSHIPNMHNRLLEPIDRNLSTLGQGNGEPIIKTYKNTGINALERDNIWFFTTQNGSTFNPNKGADNCTAESPCQSTDFNQANVNTIDGITPNTNFYMNQGDYSLNGILTLQEGQSMWGRSDDFKSAATDAERPLFSGGLALDGDNSLSNLNLTGQGTQVTTGIYAHDVDNVSLNHVNVSDYIAKNGNDAVGIDIANAQEASLNQVVVANIQGGAGEDGHNGGAGGNATGILMNQVQQVYLNQVLVNQIKGGDGGRGADGNDGSNGGNGGIGGNAIGINLNGIGTAQMQNTKIVNIEGGRGGDAGRGGETGFMGDGGSGGNGGAAGNATGLQVAGADHLIVTGIILTDLHGGDAGRGGDGGKGTDGLGGNGGDGGSGGHGGNVTGMDLSGITSANIKDATLLNLESGRGGDAGHGADGGKGGSSGIGGQGGSGGDGGSAGNVLGIQVANTQTITLEHTLIDQLHGGDAGRGGDSGHGGDALDQGGNGGNGGNGGDGGNVTGIAVNNAGTLVMANTHIDHLESGHGGDTGRGADAGKGYIYSGGNGGDGGDGGSAGNISGIVISQVNSVQMQDTFLSNLLAEDGARGGDSGRGGDGQIQGGNAGDGGNGGTGGSVTGISLNNVTTASIENTVMENLIAGLGCDAGRGADAGKGTEADGSRGSGGNGGAGGNASAFAISDNSTVTLDNSKLFKVQGGQGGNGGDGGQGGHGGKGGAGGAAQPINDDGSNYITNQNMTAVNFVSGQNGQDGKPSQRLQSIIQNVPTETAFNDSVLIQFINDFFNPEEKPK